MTKTFFRMSLMPMLLILLAVAGCGGGGGGGGGGGNESRTTSTDGETGEASHPVNNQLDGYQSDPSTIAWLPPTQNADDSAFTDLVGYKIYLGKEKGRYEIVQTLKDPGLTEYFIENVPPGKYYVAMTAVNSQNIESPLSNVVVKVVGE